MEYKNILIIKMSSLGDVVHTLPFVSFDIAGTFSSGIAALSGLCVGDETPLP